ncbi:RNA polymerase sigma-70 factor [Pedobacter frigoris]|uniref:RNA polymerase sigma factor n=1 Tax=Pedobacter frigoris TaxID=2571272 RepID=UPI00292EBAD0|nr:RNA polymerase sigma-70 factor [Pedobacter frigoris]
MQIQQSESWNEQDILVKLKEGDESAFGKFYAHYSEMIYGRLLRLLKDQDMADEIIQDLFLKIWEKRQQINPSQSLKSYLYTIAENLVYDHFRKVARDRKLQERFRQVTTELYSHTEEDLLNKENKEIIDQAIASLPPQRRKAFVLCKVEGKSYEEAARLMGVSSSTVSNHLVKATSAIRDYIRKSGNLAPALFLAFLFKGL